MTNQQHPITPSAELVKQWAAASHKSIQTTQPLLNLCALAAQWGADAQLEMDAGWVALQTSNLMSADRLRAEMRPKPPSLKEQALLQLDNLNADLAMHGRGCDLSQIRRALEQLP